jgi:hypothetical protein
MDISQSQSYITTDGQSVCVSWCRAPSGAHDQIFVYCLTVTVLSMGGRPLWRESGSVLCLSQSTVIAKCRYIHIYTVLNGDIFQYTIIQYIQGLCQSGPGTANYALLSVAFATTAVLDTWTIVGYKRTIQWLCYRLKREWGFSVLQGQIYFFSRVQIHSACYQMGAEGVLTGGKASGAQSW